jgi:hypothetical protein
MTDTFSTAVVGNDIDAVSDPKPFGDVVSFGLRIAAGLEDGFIRTFREAGTARNTFFGDQ